MRRIIYYVAVSLDGFISGPDNDVSLFRTEGSGVIQFRKDLQEFDTVIMGRRTYEFGYAYGMIPGQPAYPDMEHFIFSNTLEFNNPHDAVHVKERELQQIDDLKNSGGSDIYLCGGGVFAGWLLDNGRIDVLKIKLNPIILGGGVKLFGGSRTRATLVLLESQGYDHGLQILTYDLQK
jgi:dihydrofolate reductase